jgi:hypothetical protein
MFHQLISNPDEKVSYIKRKYFRASIQITQTKTNNAPVPSLMPSVAVGNCSSGLIGISETI